MAMIVPVLFVLALLILWAGVYSFLPAGSSMAGRVLASLIRWLRRRQRFDAWYGRSTARLRPLRSYWPLAAALAVGFMVAALTGYMFVELAEAIQASSPRLERLDEAVWRSVPQFRSSAATRFFHALSVLGTGVSLGALALLVAAVLWRRGGQPWAVYLIVTAAGSLALNEGLKQLYARSRPDLASALWQARGYAFPSGHAMSSVAILGGLAYMVVHNSRSWLVRSATISFAAWLIVAISISRVYLGAHWVSDVVAGLAAGLVWQAATSAIHAAFRRRGSASG